MERTVVEGDLHVHHGISRQRAAFHGLLDAFFHRRYIVTWDDAADDLIDELEAAPTLEWLDLEPAVAVLTPAARLPFISPLHFGRGANRLFIGYTRCLHLHVTAELAPQTVHHHLEMLLTQPRHQQLSRLRVAPHVQRWILLHEPDQPLTHLLLVGFGFRLDRKRDRRLRKFNGRQDDGFFFVAESIAGGRSFQLGNRHNIPDGGDPERGLRFALEHENLADTLALVACGVVYHRVRRNMAGEDP